ncbi:hypothetical protein FB451DRAFT_1170017 [Mycena latifolia]|nr:hypothetical protein FB451DRAFT_1170017 [Mycena latifolia]
MPSLAKEVNPVAVLPVVEKNPFPTFDQIKINKCQPSTFNAYDAIGLINWRRERRGCERASAGIAHKSRARAKAKKHSREVSQGERVAVAVAVAIFMRTSNKHVFRPNLVVGVLPSAKPTHASGKLVQQNTSNIRVGQRWETRLFLNLNAGMAGKGMGMWGRGRPEWSGRIKKTYRAGTNINVAFNLSLSLMLRVPGKKEDAERAFGFFRTWTGTW